jgi:hypothetical protein
LKPMGGCLEGWGLVVQSGGGWVDGEGAGLDCKHHPRPYADRPILAEAGRKETVRF